MTPADRWLAVSLALMGAGVFCHLRWAWIAGEIGFGVWAFFLFWILILIAVAQSIGCHRDKVNRGRGA